MATPAQQGGASLHVRGHLPSVDLASLITLLVEALPPRRSSDGALSWPVLHSDPDSNRLVLNTYGVLCRLVGSEEFRQRFKEGRTSGFLRDLLAPRGRDARMGGEIFENRLDLVSDGVDALRHHLARALDESGCRLDDLIVPDAGEAVATLATRMQAPDPFRELTARLIPIEFADSERPASVRESDVARLISVEERVQADDWLHRLTEAIVGRQSRRDDDFDSVQREMLVETLEQDARRADSQVSRFLAFLEEDALSRVRLQVSFAIMEALSAQINANDEPQRVFRDFVGRVLSIFNHFAAPAAEHALQLDLSQDYGLNAAFSLSERLSEAGFYRCLPVWAEWNAQLFESRSFDAQAGGTSVVREVSYRFRINGRDPRSGQPHAFDSRLERLRWVLLGKGEDAIWSRSRLQRALTEVAFLWLVFNPELSCSDMPQAVPRLMERLRAVGAVADLLDELQAWSQRVVVLGRTLVELLQSKSRNVATHAQRAIADSYIVVQQGIVDWAALDRSRGRARDPLMKGIAGAADQAEWFKHVKIARAPNDVPGSLFSVHVSTVLHERALAVGDAESLSLRTIREVPEGVLNLCWVPIRVDRRQHPNRATMRHAIAPEWKMRGGVDVWYEPELLRRRNRADFPEQDQHQYRAAAATGLAVLVYVLLQLVVERCERARGRRPTTVMLRFQTQGKGTPDTEGEPLVYAVAQAIESALLRDAPVRMQGIVVQGTDLQWKERGTVSALASALPLFMSAPESAAVVKVAIIVYSARPCDEHPQIADADGHVFRAKTYLSRRSVSRSGAIASASIACKPTWCMAATTYARRS